MNSTSGPAAAEERNMGIEALRIAATFAVMVLHVLGQGGVLGHLTPFSAGYETAWFLEIMMLFSSTAYGLITGYVCAERRFRISNLVYVALQVLFYTVLTTAVFAFIKPGSVGRGELVSMLFPAMTEQYWYYTAYVGMFFLIPMMNHAIITFYRRYADITLAAFVLLFSIFPVFFSTDVFGLRGGNSFVTLILCYYVGAYIRHFDALKKLTNSKLLILNLLSVTLTFVFKLVIELTMGYDSFESGHSGRLLGFNSPTILVAAVSLLVFFSRLKLSEKAVRLVKLIAPLTFGIYLLNSHPLIWRYYMLDRYEKYASYPAVLMILCVLLSAAVNFLLGCAADSLRRLIFETGHLREKLRVLEDRILRKADTK
ncbi:MAG: acyltransferase family protein [Lachnospiraceae bacterium]|nr:acyltransferase family protein [Lachnospiraceae bacterium]